VRTGRSSSGGARVTIQDFSARMRLPVSAGEAYAWHARPGALQRLSPPWRDVDVLEQGAGLDEGTRVVLRLRAGPFRGRWVAVHGPCVPGREFRDRAERGPFASWEHVHSFVPDGPADGPPDGPPDRQQACWLEDRVRWELPLAAVSQPVAGAAVRAQVARLFRYRHDTTAADLAAHAGLPRLRVLVSGAGGLVGRQLVAFLSTGGHEVVRLARAGAAHEPVAGVASMIAWDPVTGAVGGAMDGVVDRAVDGAVGRAEGGAAKASPLEGFDAVVHLAGEPIAGRRWSAEHKAAVRDSRIGPTAALSRALASLRRKPAVYACASAVGYYGHRGDEVLTEDSDPGLGFLPDVCEAWEAATAPAARAGIRTVNLRLGIVLTPQGGALRKLLTPFRLGLGGPIGDGTQWWSWISLDDVLGAIHHVLRTESISGPCHVVAPQPLPNAEFANALGAVLRRPALLPMPEKAATRLLGEMADALLLSSARAVPLALIHSGYAFRHPDLPGALRHLLGRTAS
jgi:uncharacterized protein